MIGDNSETETVFTELSNVMDMQDCGSFFKMKLKKKRNDNIESIPSMIGDNSETEYVFSYQLHECSQPIYFLMLRKSFFANRNLLELFGHFYPPPSPQKNTPNTLKLSPY